MTTNDTRLITLTADELLQEWMLRRGYATARSDCQVQRTDSYCTTPMLRRAVHRWYVDTLHTAPMHMLPLRSLIAQATLTRAPDGAGVVTLPEPCMRIASVQLSHWTKPATPVTDPLHPDVMAQSSPWAQAGIWQPVALHLWPSQLRLYPGAEGPLTLLTGVTMPPDLPEAYTLTTEMLTLIPPYHTDDTI